MNKTQNDSDLITLTSGEKEFISTLRQFKLSLAYHLESGLFAYFCGGWIRDKLLKIDSKDLDMIMSKQHISSFINLLREINIKGKAKVEVKMPVILTNYNCQGLELLQIKFNDLKIDIRQSLDSKDLRDDLRTRDFRCNSLFYDPFENKILDFANGVVDIEKKALNVVQSFEQTFMTDFSRFIRLVRFKVTKNFSIPWDIESQIQNLSSFEIREAEGKYIKGRDHALLEFKRVFSNSKCLQIFEEMDRLMIFKPLFLSRNISGPGIQNTIHLMKKINAFFDSYFFRENAFEEI